MFKISLAGSALLSVAQAIALRNNLALAQTDSSCDCDSKITVISSGCCAEEPKPDPPVVPPPEPDTPLGDIEMNLDVLLTHILHEVHPDIPEWPETNTPEERTMITEVIEPVVIQLLNDDIAPAMPTCTLPGQQGSASIVDDSPTLIENAEIVADLISETLKDYDMTEGVTYEQLLDENMPSDEILANLNIESAEGEEIVTAMLEQVRNTAAALSEAQDDINDEFQGDLEEAGLDTEENAEEIE